MPPHLPRDVSFSLAPGGRVIERMFALARERGTAILPVTHDANLGARADRQLDMNQGRLTEGTRAAERAAA